ncbi:hypothetical protein DMA12_20755 [Amycolatopsis balhimycina DSM 5908]|uniref:Uncharacterized protein n=1 Tax=Amycolatopsis balhimycina DSM 5908 TaxID=1081091 RepID=A0A428WHY6_AMYBA|nr:hypothetical protein [Amycolatopsis balhimycina]RSM42656.1 hypothetical protein DMA12_20755 [Amycolatopsis balhimycina DSM 5908]
MANNYTRISYTLRQIVERTRWSSRAEVVEEIRQAKPVEMKIRGDGSSDDHYMSARALDDLLSLMVDLRLVTVDNRGRVSASIEGRRAADDPSIYDLLIKSSIRSLLEQDGCPIGKVLDTVRGIRLPAVPDAKTIHDRLKANNKSMTLNLDRFRRLLYMYACAGGIDRLVRVHYRQANG